MSGRPKPPTIRQFVKSQGWNYLFLAPMVVLTGLFVVYPLLASVPITLYAWDGIGRPTHYVGLTNFVRVASDPLFWNAFRHTFEYALVLVPVQLGIALLLALVLNNPNLRGATVYRAIYFSPVVTSAAVIGIIMTFLANNLNQPLNDLLLGRGLISTPIDILGSPTLALPAIIIVGIWQTLGYNLVYFLAGLQSIPKVLYEAAAVDGANAWQRYWNITIPMLRDVGTVILFLAILGSLQVFDLVFVMTGGGPYYASEVVATYIYHYAFTPAAVQAENNIGYASAAAFFMGLILIVFTALLTASVSYLRRQQKAT